MKLAWKLNHIFISHRTLNQGQYDWRRRGYDRYLIEKYNSADSSQYYSNWGCQDSLLLFFLWRHFAQKKPQALFKYLNTPKKHNKEHKQLSFRCKAMNFYSNICLKKYSWYKMQWITFCLNISLLKKQDVTSNFHQNNKPKKHK